MSDYLPPGLARTGLLILVCLLILVNSCWLFDLQWRRVVYLSYEHHEQGVTVF